MKKPLLFLIFALMVVMVFLGCGKKGEEGKRRTKVFLRLNPGGHTAMVRDLFFFDHGKRLLSASDDKTIRIWDVSDLKHPRLINTIRGEIGRGPFGMVFAIAVDPLGRFLAVGGWLHDKADIRSSVRLHDLKTGNVLQVLKGHEDVVGELAFSPDGRYLASGGGDCSVIIWKRDKDGFRFYKRLKGHTDSIYALSFSLDRLASGAFDNTVRLYDVKGNFRLIKVLRDHEDKVCAVAFSPDGRYLVTGSWDKRILLYDKDGNLIREFSKKETRPAAFSFSPDGRFLLAGSYGSAYDYEICYLYAFPSGNVIRAFKEHKNTVGAVSVTQRDGRLILATAGGEADEILLWDRNGKILSRMESVGTRIMSIALSPDGKKLAFGFTTLGKKYLFDLKEMKLRPLSCKAGFFMARHKRGKLSLELNPHLSQRLGLDFPQSLLEVKREGEVIAVIRDRGGFREEKIGTKKVVVARIIRSRADGYKHVCFSFINDRFFVSGGLSGMVFVYNLKGEKVAELLGHQGAVWSVSVDESGKWVATSSSDQTISLFYVGDLKDVYWGSGVDWGKLKEADPLTYRNWAPHKEYLETLKSQNPTLYRAFVNMLKDVYMPVRKVLPVLTIFPSKDGKEWVAWTPEGYFTASSPSALKLIGYHINQGFYHQAKWVWFSQLYDQYFRPDLVRLKLVKPTEDLSKYTKLAKVEEALETSPPPEVEIISPKEGEVVRSEFVTVKVKVKDTGGKIGDIRVYVNGKLAASEGIYRVAEAYEGVMLAEAKGLYASARGVRMVRRLWTSAKEGGPSVITIREYKPLSGTAIKSYRIRLAPGENTITAQALNGENTILSGPAVVKIKADVPKRAPRLFLLALGVKNFANGRYNLRYTLEDATAFTERMKGDARGVYPEVITRLLVDPTKKDVLRAFFELSREVMPEDVFVFYAATHGEVTDDRYWLITRDFAGDLTEEAALTSDEIMELMKVLPAQRQVMILDTCHAGAVDWTVADLYQARLMAFSMGSGMHVLSAASSQELANEGYQGHGHFTYFVIKALEGEADANHDKKITVVEMGPYVKARVEKVTGGAQRPIAINCGSDVVMIGR